MCIGAGIAFASDNSNPEGEAIAASTLRVTYDVGSYSDTTVVLGGSVCTFPTARFKRTNDDAASHKTTRYEPYNGGAAKSAVQCVSDGLQATDWVVVSSTVNAHNHMYYDDGYGTLGYSDRLKVYCYTGGYLDSSITLGGTWCPDESYYG